MVIGLPCESSRPTASGFHNPPRSWSDLRPLMGSCCHFGKGRGDNSPIPGLSPAPSRPAAGREACTEIPAVVFTGINPDRLRPGSARAG